ncbi:atrial natriuretic peptide receptor 1-like isoform X2 [Paramacrobiotus metropolitanus]|uniref:atrial natriuretic peptide receptor 1-like isoform X2 n=1 Tax=Paramacrobiotus metropolitanus TaxID=2943436 RepID=UPI00244591B6|nr:atrial natriuretic peptide receptor 1-like isoform X2 [Paramacrobiotus metropolitanus]
MHKVLCVSSIFCALSSLTAQQQNSILWPVDPAPLLNAISMVNSTVMDGSCMPSFMYIQSSNYTGMFTNPLTVSMTQIGLEIYYAACQSKRHDYFLGYTGYQRFIDTGTKFVSYMEELYFEDCFRTGLSCNIDQKQNKLRGLGRTVQGAMEDYVFSGVLDISHLRRFVFSQMAQLQPLATYLLQFGIDLEANFIPLLNCSIDIFYLLPNADSYRNDSSELNNTIPQPTVRNIFPAILHAVAKNRKDKGVFLNLISLLWYPEFYSGFSGSSDTMMPSYLPACAEGGTDVHVVLGQTVDMLDGHVISVLLAPPCRLELKAASQLADLYNVTTFTGGGELIGNYSKYPFIVRTAYSPIYVWEGLVAFAALYAWETFFIIYDDMSTNLLDAQEKTILADGLSYILHQKGWNVILVRHHEDSDVEPNLAALRKAARIVVIVSNKSIFRKYMMAASNLGMCKGDYAFIALDTFKDPYFNNSQPWQAGDGNDDKAKTAYEAVLIVGIADPASQIAQMMGDFEQDIGASSYAIFLGQSTFLYGVPNYYTASYFDVLMLLGQRVKDATNAAVETWKRDGVPYLEFTTKLSTFLRKQNYFNIVEKNGMTGDVVIDIEGNRLQNTMIFDMLENGQFAPVFNYSTSLKKSQSGTLRWPQGKSPVSRPFCGFEGENPACAPMSTNSILTIAMTIILSVMAVIIIAVCYTRNEKRKIAERNWIAKLDDVQYPRDMHDWVRRRYTLIDDGAGGVAVGDAVRTARKAMTARLGRGSVVREMEHLDRMRLSLKKTGHKSQGVYKKLPVTIRHCQKKVVYLTQQVLQEVKTVRTMKSDDNIIKFLAASMDWEKVAIFYEFCAKGTLQDLIVSSHFRLDWTMRLTVIGDLLRGLTHIHASSLEAHGRLTSKCIHVDNRFVLKIADYGLPSFFSLTVEETQELKDTGELWDMLLWTAPEHIGVILGGEMTNFIAKRDRRSSQIGPPISRNMKRYRMANEKSRYERDQLMHEQAMSAKSGSRQGDIFSVAIIMSEVFLAAKPYSMYPFLSSEEIVSHVRDRLTSEVPFRPQIAVEDCGHPELHKLLLRCWSDQYNKRPTLTAVRIALKEIGEELGIGSKTTSIMDVMLGRMEEQAVELQQRIAERTKSIQQEKSQFFQLVAEVLPKSTADRLRHDETIAPELYDIVTLLMCDVVNFQEILEGCSPAVVVEFVTDLYRYYESVTTEYECITVDIQQALVMIASGLPVRNGIFNAREIARVALTMLFKTTKFHIPWKPQAHLIFRMAVNTGPVVAGVIGQMCPKYCVFGETVFVAHRLLAVTKVTQILCSSTACNLMETFGSFVLIRLQDIFLKGKGFVPSYSLCGENANPTIQRLETEFRSAVPDAGRGE